jgi:hypothetical protein
MVFEISLLKYLGQSLRNWPISQESVWFLRNTGQAIETVPGIPKSGIQPPHVTSFCRGNKRARSRLIG